MGIEVLQPPLNVTAKGCEKDAEWSDAAAACNPSWRYRGLRLTLASACDTVPLSVLLSRPRLEGHNQII
jgi:hypothetical protein